MVVIEREPGLSVRIGPYTLQVLAVEAGKVTFALMDPERDCCCCGERPAERRRCPECLTEAVVCPACAWRCPVCEASCEQA
jgi:hypothetical protein